MYEDLDFEIQIVKEETGLYVTEHHGCRICINPGGVPAPKTLIVHGTSLSVRTEAGKRLFILNFRREQIVVKQDYDRRIYLPIESEAQIVIGGVPGAQIQLRDPCASKEDVLLKMKRRTWYAAVRHSRMKVLCNGVPFSGEIQLAEGAFLTIGLCNFYYKQGCLYTTGKDEMNIRNLISDTAEASAGAVGYPKFTKSVRLMPKIDERPIEVLLPQPELSDKKEPTLQLIMPAAVALGLAIIAHGLMQRDNILVIWAILLLAVMVIIAVFIRIRCRRMTAQRERRRRKTYLAYIQKKIDEIILARQEESECRHRIFRPAQENLDNVIGFDKGLFDRSPGDEDFLAIRLGTGTIEAAKEIHIEKSPFASPDDKLMTIPRRLKEKYDTIENAPIVSFLTKGNGVSVIGSRRNLYEMVKIMTMDLAVRHDDQDVRFLYLIDPGDVQQFEWAKWLRHCRGNEHGLRRIVCDEESAGKYLLDLYEELKKRSQRWKNGAVQWENRIVVFVYRSHYLRSYPIFAFLEKCGKLGVYFIFFEEADGLVPRGSRELIYLDNEGTEGRLVLCDQENRQISFRYHPIAADTLMLVARKTFPIEMAEEQRTDNNRKDVSLIDILACDAKDLNCIERRWSLNDVCRRMSAPIGQLSDGRIAAVELQNPNKPIGIFAGDKGMGITQALSSYMLGLAVQFHPHEAGFLLIDTQEGGLHAQLSGLPHIMDMADGKEENRIVRVLEALHKEIERRRELMMRTGISGIDAYLQIHRKATDPEAVPYIVIVVDDSEILKKNHPREYAALIESVLAAKHRGIRLILGTHEPAEIMDGRLEANVGFRLSFGTRSAHKSMRMLGTDAAIRIEAPGYAYLKAEGEQRISLLKIAYTGAKGCEKANAGYGHRIAELNFWGKQKVVYSGGKFAECVPRSDAEILIDGIGRACRNFGIEHVSMIPAEEQ